MLLKDLEGGNTIVFDKRCAPSMLLFYRWLTACPTAQYHRQRDDFAINGLIMLCDDSASIGAANRRKSAILYEVTIISIIESAQKKISRQTRRRQNLLWRKNSIAKSKLFFLKFKS